MVMRTFANRLLWITAVVGWLSACKEHPQQPAAAVAQPAPQPAQAPEVVAPPAAIPDEEEPPPSGPVVEVNVASDPAAPLAWFRGYSTEKGHEAALLWTRGQNTHKALAIEDGQIALRGADKPAGARRGPANPALGYPIVVSIGAKWCKPCSEELADVLELSGAAGPAADAQQPAEAVRLIFVLEGTSDEWPLAEVRDELFSRHAKSKGRAKPLAVPQWAEFRGDLESAWGDVIGKLGVLGGDRAALPINLLLDSCGHVQAAATGSLDERKKAAFRAQLAKLQRATCVPAPAWTAPIVRTPAPPKPRPAEPARPDRAASPDATAPAPPPSPVGAPDPAPAPPEGAHKSSEPKAEVPAKPAEGASKPAADTKAPATPAKDPKAAEKPEASGAAKTEHTAEPKPTDKEKDNRGAEPAAKSK